MKRFFDFCCAFVGLLVLLPIFGLLCIAVAAGGSGPVFYRGERLGRNGRHFKLLKFRTMVVDAERKGGPSTSGDDPRVTRVGLVLRRFKLDELPQLLNVIAGQMSIVGPRPEVPSEIDVYQGEYEKVLKLRPGITDWASIWNSDEGSALAGAVDAHAAYQEYIQPTKLELQLKYYQERSLALDVKLIAYTLLKIVNRSWTPHELNGYPSPSMHPRG